MRAIVIKNYCWDGVAPVLPGYDLVIKIVPLFKAVVYPDPTNKSLHKALDRLSWSEASFAPTINFSFFPKTESEIIALLKAAFKDLEVYVITKHPSG